MKKVFFSLAVLATVALVSCGGKKAENADSAVETAAVAEEVVTETVDSPAAGDTTVAVEAAAAEVAEAPAADSAAK